MFKCKIDPDAGLALAVKWGVLTGKDMVGTAHLLHGDPDWRPDFDVIWDCRGILKLVLEPADVPPMVAAHLENSTGEDVIVVRRQVDYSVSMLYAHLARREDKAVTVCWTMEEALAALGRDALPAALEEWHAGEWREAGGSAGG